MIPIPVYPFRLVFTADRPGRRYLGSPWRGAFGHWLKRSVCMFPQGECGACPLRSHCVFVSVFASEHFDGSGSRLAAYALRPQWQDDQMYLFLTLFGHKAAKSLPYLIHALKEGGRRGVANKHFAFESIESWHDGEWRILNGACKPLEQMEPSPDHSIRVKMITPLRFKHRGRLVGSREMSLKLWLKALEGRLKQLSKQFGDADELNVRAVEDQEGWREARWHWREFPRYSRQQKTDMKIGGLLGEFVLDSSLAKELWPVLWLGQWTHAGKLATMGLGRYELEVFDQ